MSFSIRPFRVPADFAAEAALFAFVNPEPDSVAELEESERNLPEGAIVYRLIAQDLEGRAVGYGSAVHMPWSQEGLFYLYVVVEPAQQRQGIGSALAAELDSYAIASGARQFSVEIRDNDPQSRTFAEKRGYRYDRHLFESTLDLPSFDPSPFEGVVEAVKASGIRFFTLADEPGAEHEHQFYRTNAETARDIPGYRGQFPPYEEFRKFAFDSPSVRRDCLIVAADGERFAGVTAMGPIGETEGMMTHYTGVYREYRGRKIALALKLLAIEAAVRHGAQYMRTNNDSQNAPMLAVNRKLGYQPAPGLYRMEKTYIDIIELVAVPCNGPFGPACAS